MTDNNSPENKPTRGRPKGAVDKVPRNKPNAYAAMQPGDPEAITRHNFALMQLPSIDRDNREEIEERIRLYFDLCIQNDMRPGVAGVCLALGISRQTWQTWGAGTRRDGKYSDIVLRTRQALEAVLEQYMLKGKINPVSGIFLLKNCYGYQDKSELLVAPVNPLGDGQTEEQLRQKYMDRTYGLIESEEVGQYGHFPSGDAENEETCTGS